jgi:4-amino-4-deoxy-L-arabinose transferase-like glycosyltransferase
VIALGTLGRLYRIDGPPFGYHWCRQYDTAAIARNFAEGAMNPLYPQIDWRGDSPGYVESEFPAYTYLVALLYRTFGIHEWLGRALNVAFYALSALLLFRLARLLLDEWTAAAAVFFYSVAPLSVYFTRSLQPDALMCLASLAGLYFFLRWTEGSRLRDLVLSGLGVTLAILIKPFTVYVALPLGYLAWRKGGWRLFAQKTLWVYAAAVIAGPLLWYVHAFSLWETYGNTLFRGYARLDVPALTDPFWPSFLRVLLLRVATLITTPAGLVFLVAGLAAGAPRGNRVLYWWAAGFGLSVLLVNEANFDHEYYQLPIVFAASIWMAQGARTLVERRWLSRWTVAALCLCAVGLSAWRLRDWYAIEPPERDAVRFGKRVADLTEPAALVAFVELGDDPRRGEWFQYRFAPGEYLMYIPLQLYLSHRKGWSLGGVSVELVEKLRERGARYLATPYPEMISADPALVAWLESRYTVVEKTPRWAIYRLR